MVKKEATPGILEKLVPVLLLASIILAFVVGMLWQKVSSLQSGNAVATQTAQTTQNAGQQAPPQVSLDIVKETFDKAAIKFGDTKKKLVLIEVADPSCPYCSIAAGENPELNKQASNAQSDFTLVTDGGTYIAPVPEMKKLLDSGKAAFAYIYVPGHGNGEMGTKALYCAFDKNKFWEVHDKLMTAEGYKVLNETVKNDKAKTQELVDFLKSAMNPNDLKTCLDSGKYDSRLTEDVTLAQGLGVNATPGFFVNATVFRGAYNFKDMEGAVNEALK